MYCSWPRTSCGDNSKRKAAIRLLRISLDFVSDQSIESLSIDQPDRAVGIDSHAHLSSRIPNHLPGPDNGRLLVPGLMNT
jgi:hypothetical protein